MMFIIYMTFTISIPNPESFFCIVTMNLSLFYLLIIFYWDILLPESFKFLLKQVIRNNTNTHPSTHLWDRPKNHLTFLSAIYRHPPSHWWRNFTEKLITNDKKKTLQPRPNPPYTVNWFVDGPCFYRYVLVFVW